MSIQNRESPSSNENYNQNQAASQDEHLERIDSESQRFFGESRPGDPTHIIDVRPPELIPDIIRSNPNRAKKIAAGVFAGLAVVGVGGYFGIKSTANDTIERFENPLPANSAPEVPGQDMQTIPTEQAPTAPMDAASVPESNNVYTYTIEELDEMAPSAFAQLDVTTRLDYSVERLLETREQAIDVIMQQGTPAQAAAVSDNSTKEQKILNDYAADVLSSGSQGQDLASVNKGMKLLSIVISPDNPNFANVVDDIADDENMLSVYQANEDYKYQTIKDAQFMDREIGPNGAEIIRVTNVESGEETVMLFEKAVSSKGDEAYIYTGNYNIYEAPQLDYQLQQYRIRE